MSYLFAEALSEEFKRMYEAAYPGKSADVYIYDPDNKPFIAHVGGKTVRFTVPEDMLHSSPLKVVSKRYLEPLLKRLPPA